MIFDLHSNLMKWIFAFSAILICIGCLLPANWLPPIKNDKLIHFLSFASLTFMVNFFSESTVELLFWMLILAAAGFIIEILQKFVPGRNFCWKDFLSNIAGIFSSAIICGFF